MRFDLPLTMTASLACSLAIACSGQLSTSGGSSDSPDAASVTTTTFRPGIQHDLDAAGCTIAACHGGTVAPMPLIANPVAENDWQANYNQVKARAGTLSSSLLIDKATGAGDHVASLSMGDAMMDRWLEWLGEGAPYEAASSFADAGTGNPIDAGASVDGNSALTWEADIRPMLNARNCLDCHGNDGAYSLETYSAMQGFGTDGIANVIPGDPTSLLIEYCEQGHFNMPAADTLKVISWIVDFDARER